MIWKVLIRFINDKLVELVETNDVFLDMGKVLTKRKWGEKKNHLVVAELLKAEKDSA